MDTLSLAAVRAGLLLNYSPVSLSMVIPTRVQRQTLSLLIHPSLAIRRWIAEAVKHADAHTTKHLYQRGDGADDASDRRTFFTML